MKDIGPIILSAIVLTAAGLGQRLQPATAQEVPPQVPPDTQTQIFAPLAAGEEPNCGMWQNGTWIPTGSCGPNDYRSHVVGTITFVKGHLVTIQQAAQSLVINDQPALERRTSGRVAVGRQVVASGYWRDGTFYATTLT